jgi:glycosyltransferase involved in cell wall biosynthesis
VPLTWLERKVKRPNLARYRAAQQAVHAAAARKHDSILVSHLPALTAATNVLRRMYCPDIRQIAFAFNFTDLPTGARLSYFRWALRGIDEFVIFSEVEREIYSKTFGIPQDRFRMLHWAMDTPVAGPDNPVPFKGNYLCAIGGEGRDYALLAEAMQQLPEVNLAIVARPHSIDGIRFPPNVHVFTNLPGAQTWRLAQDSIGLVVPLKSADTTCGHVTIVGAQLLNIPLIVTRSTGVLDYVAEDTACLVNPGNTSEMVDALHAVSAQSQSVRDRQQLALEKARTRNHLDHWVRYFEDVLVS